MEREAEINMSGIMNPLGLLTLTWIIKHYCQFASPQIIMQDVLIHSTKWSAKLNDVLITWINSKSARWMMEKFHQMLIYNVDISTQNIVQSLLEIVYGAKMSKLLMQWPWTMAFNLLYEHILSLSSVNRG